MPKKELRYTKKDFQVGQEVYIERTYARSRTSELEGDIHTEIVEKVGTKFVTTNKRKYCLSDGREATEYSPAFEIWTSKEEVEEKVAKDRAFSGLQNKFEKSFGTGNQLKNKLTLDEMNHFLHIIAEAEARD